MRPHSGRTFCATAKRRAHGKEGLSRRGTDASLGSASGRTETGQAPAEARGPSAAAGLRSERRVGTAAGNRSARVRRLSEGWPHLGQDGCPAPRSRLMWPGEPPADLITASRASLDEAQRMLGATASAFVHWDSGARTLRRCCLCLEGAARVRIDRLRAALPRFVQRWHEPVPPPLSNHSPPDLDEGPGSDKRKPGLSKTCSM